MSSLYILVIFSYDTTIVVVLSLIIFVNQSTITTIMLLLFDLGNGLMLISYHVLWYFSNR